VSFADNDQRIRAAIAGNDHALAELMRSYQDRLLRFGVRTCRDPSDAEDAVQEAFIKLSRRPDVQRDGGVLSWLMSTVRNACLRLLRSLRRRRAQVDHSALGAVADGPSPEESLDRWRLVYRLQRIIAGLPRDRREVLILRDIEGLPADRVCASLGLTEAAMKSRLHRARALVRSQLLDAEARPDQDREQDRDEN
jgi:RNA polymerase sigma-70 factor, ECF subfamily